MARISLLTVRFILLWALSLLCGIFVEAQSSRSPRPTPTPQVPEIVSRAEDFPDESPTKPVESRPQTPVNSADAVPRRRQQSVRAEDKAAKEAAARERLALNLDILTKAEQRSDSLRKQLFEMIEKENSIRSRLDQIDNDLRPEAIDRQLATIGSLRPEELRAQRRRSLEFERQNLNNLLTEVLKARASLETNLARSESLVERLRTRLEKDIDDALETADQP